MRLLSSKTLELHEFMDNEIPPYAILSHRWRASAEEVSFQDCQKGYAKSKPGYEKITRTCEAARLAGLDFVWIDTCCIDKASSSELSEAINSMFRYYQDAHVCFAYLFDVDSSKPDRLDLFRSSWFNRSWTLQELLAPRTVEFYDGNWKHFGSKRDLASEISRITNIDSAILEAKLTTSVRLLKNYSIATKMSWASDRSASRVEDIAYSLLGIFEVNMPLLYGEGQRAFIRLQEEIMKHSDDHTLFAWSTSAPCQRGLLANSPKAFTNSGNIERMPKGQLLHRAPYSVTNMGLSIELKMIPWAMDVYLAALDAAKSAGRIGIFLHYLDEEHQYARIAVDGEDIAPFPHDLVSKAKVRKIYIRQSVWYDSYQPKPYGFLLRGLPKNYELTKTVSRTGDNPAKLPNFLGIPNGERGTAGAVWFGSGANLSMLKLGFDKDFDIKIFVLGRLWMDDGEIENPHPYDLEFADEIHLHDNWTDEPDGRYIAHIPRGLGAAIHRPSAVLSIWEETTKGRRFWVVDIIEADSLSERRRLLKS